jgi:hypothetical protein
MVNEMSKVGNLRTRFDVLCSHAETAWAPCKALRTERFRAG